MDDLCHCDFFSPLFLFGFGFCVSHFYGLERSCIKMWAQKLWQIHFVCVCAILSTPFFFCFIITLSSEPGIYRAWVIRYIERRTFHGVAKNKKQAENIAEQKVKLRDERRIARLCFFSVKNLSVYGQKKCVDILVSSVEKARTGERQIKCMFGKKI